MKTHHVSLTESMPLPPETQDWLFVEELRRPRQRKTLWSSTGAAKAGTGDLDLADGIAYLGGFPDPDGRLPTAEDSLASFLKAASLENPDGIPLRTELNTTHPKEGYLLEVSRSGLRLEASDTEGIRRGLYELEDRISGAPGPFLPYGTYQKRFRIRNRISRCFFGPIKRPPLNRDELMDDVDYYPDAYLDRLAHEGINGLWLTVALNEVSHSSISPPHSTAGKRLRKLRRTVDRCLRYGIRTWVFCIEPRAMLPEDPLLANHPELRGAISYDGRYCFCPSSETADRHLFEMTRNLFAAVPGLGGMINISHGERATTCLSKIGLVETPIECPRCSRVKPWQIAHRSLSALSGGIRAANPEAELISWFYAPYPDTHAEWMFEMAANIPEGVIIQYNFESGLMLKQLGKPRVGGDYWLSAAGPAANFARVAERAVAAGTQVSAKLQAGCSHEVATAPFVPVPGLLYRKFAAMHRLGCSHTMLCWYFGNYPGLMNRAAGLLASEDFTGGEQDFLLRLAHAEWGDAAETVVEAWAHLAEGYANYPLDNMPGYYGPMHDGTVWPLHLRVALAPLAPTWLAGRYPSGDMVGESLGAFSLAETLELCERICESWEKGTALLRKIKPRFADNPERLRDIGVAEALRTQFRSGRNIYRFYYLRFLLIHGRARSAEAWDEIRELIEEEIDNSAKMLELCASDSRLGFHSEAETYKVYPEKLRWRMEQLRDLLHKELPYVRSEHESGKPILRIPPEQGLSYKIGQGWIEGESLRWRCDADGAGMVFKVECRETENGLPAYAHLYLLDRAGITTPRRFFLGPDISATAAARINPPCGVPRYARTSPHSWEGEIRIAALSWNDDEALRPAYISVMTTTEAERVVVKEEHWPPTDKPRLFRLNLARFDPRCMAHLVFD